MIGGQPPPTAAAGPSSTWIRRAPDRWGPPRAMATMPADRRCPSKPMPNAPSWTTVEQLLPSLVPNCCSMAGDSAGLPWGSAASCGRSWASNPSMMPPRSWASKYSKVVAGKCAGEVRCRPDRRCRDRGRGAGALAPMARWSLATCGVARDPRVGRLASCAHEPSGRPPAGRASAAGMAGAGRSRGRTSPGRSALAGVAPGGDIAGIGVARLGRGYRARTSRGTYFHMATTGLISRYVIRDRV